MILKKNYETITAIHIDNLWNENAFYALLGKRKYEIERKLEKKEEIWFKIKSQHVRNVLVGYFDDKTLFKHGYIKNFVNFPALFPNIIVSIRRNEPDWVFAHKDGGIDYDLLNALSELFQDTYIDGYSMKADRTIGFEVWNHIETLITDDTYSESELNGRKIKVCLVNGKWYAQEGDDAIPLKAEDQFSAIHRAYRLFGV